MQNKILSKTKKNQENPLEINRINAIFVSQNYAFCGQFAASFCH